MKRLYPLLLMLVFCSCREEYIYYECKGVQVTRVNKGKESVFYYGYCNDDDIPCPQASVVVDWSFDDFLAGFLLFHSNKTVEVIDYGGGSYKAAEGDARLFIKQYDNHQLDSLLEFNAEFGHNKQQIRFSDVISTERLMNERSKSAVMAEYNSADKTHN